MGALAPYTTASEKIPKETAQDKTMKIVNSIKSLKGRDKNNRVIRRRGRTYVINKQNPRMKTRQG